MRRVRTVYRNTIYLGHGGRQLLAVKRGVSEVVHPERLLPFRDGGHHQMHSHVVGHERHEAHHQLWVYVALRREETKEGTF